MTKQLALKNRDRGYIVSKDGNYTEDVGLSLLTTNGLRLYMEREIIRAVNKNLPPGDSVVTTLEEARAASVDVDDVLRLITEVEATTDCDIQEMHIRRPVIDYPVSNSFVIRSDFNVRLRPYVSGLYHSGLHTGTDWEISRYSDMSFPLYKRINSQSLESMTASGLDGGEDYYIRARFRSGKIFSKWSEVVNITAGQINRLRMESRPMSLFCTDIVTISAKLIDGNGSDHTLRWSQDLTNAPITWNWGQFNSLTANYTALNTSDAFFSLHIDEGTPYAEVFNLYVYRGGIEFPNSIISGGCNLEATRGEQSTSSVIKSINIGSSETRRSNDSKFISWNYRYPKDVYILEKINTATMEWQEIYRSGAGSPSYKLVGVGRYRVYNNHDSKFKNSQSNEITVSDTDDLHIGLSLTQEVRSSVDVQGFSSVPKSIKRIDEIEILNSILISDTTISEFQINSRELEIRTVSSHANSTIVSAIEVLDMTVVLQNTINIG